MDTDRYDTPLVAEFLASSLAQLLVLGRNKGRRWTKSGIADAITQDPDIIGNVTDTTIGRLLDPAYGQEPSPEKLAAVAAFLIKVRAITADQLALALTSRPLTEAAAFAALFPRPQTAAYCSFLESCRGRYSALEVRGTRLLSVDLVLRPLAASGALLAQEVMMLFDVAVMDQLKRETRNFSEDGLNGLPDKLRLAGAREMASFAFSGSAAATPDIMAIFLRGQPNGFHSVSSAIAISFSEEGAITGLTCERNSGWIAGHERRRIGPDTLPQHIAQDAARQLEYRKFKNVQIGDDRQKRKTMASSKLNNSRDFFSRDQYEGPMVFETSDHNLLESIKIGDFLSFRRALDAGIDPNQIEPQTGNPVIFALAADGRIEWVEALLATKRCDLTGVDSEGHGPSFAPAVTARMFAPTGPNEIAARFGRIARMLREEELQQRAAVSGPPRPAP